jgi:putative membrane protein
MEKIMRKVLRTCFFFGFLAIALFGCSSRPSHMEAPNREDPNMNTRGTNPINGNSAMAPRSSDSNEAVNSRANTQTADTQFLTEAAQGGLAEVELGKLAASKATNPEVKKFAQKMVDDHSKANDELKALAMQKNFSMPTEISSKHKSLMDKLNGLSGAEFDKAYVEAMVDDHEEDVKKFKDESEDGKDADVKTWAAKTLPTLQTHLDMIKGIQSKMK